MAGEFFFVHAPVFRVEVRAPLELYGIVKDTGAITTTGLHQMSHAAPLTLLLAALCLPFCGTAHAAEDDAISTDRPDFSESSQVVGKGRFQLETSVQWDRKRDDNSHDRSLYMPTLLRFGVGESTELRIETDGRTVIHAVDPASGARSSTAGYADTSVGVKWHLKDQQGNMPSMGLLLDAELPSGSRDLRGHGLRPSLRLATEWELPHGLSLAVMPGAGVDSDENGARYGYGILAATLDKKFGERVHGIVELAMPQIARASHGGTQALIDAGLTYLVNKDVQVDAMVVHGLNRRTPDLSLAVGLSVRL
jgi:hypothetical protein